MTGSTTAASVWIHSFCPRGELCADKIVSHLTRSNLAAHLAHGEDDNRPGIVASESITPELCDYVHRVSESGARRVLVLVSERGCLGQSDVWKILRSGASDVFAW